MSKIIHVVGARPNFVKLAPVVNAIYENTYWTQSIIHTGQHYDKSMSKTFFNELHIPNPDYNLNIGSTSHAEQTGRMMIELGAVIKYINPELVMVYGDVNSTLAAAMVCAKMGVLLAHVEAGLRSHDMRMPEEINRILTDRVSDILFTHCLEADTNLIAEGVNEDNIHFVGNVIIDTIVKHEDEINFTKIKNLVPEHGYALATLHRPSNVDDDNYLRLIMDTLDKISRRIPIIFPAHPRTTKRLKEIKYSPTHSNVVIIKPVTYLQSLSLQKYAKFVITDSGGMQEETTFLGIPCITVRENTERSITIEKGTNVLVDRMPYKIERAVDKILSNARTISSLPTLWDGHASERIVKKLRQYI